MLNKRFTSKIGSQMLETGTSESKNIFGWPPWKFLNKIEAADIIYFKIMVGYKIYNIFLITNSNNKKQLL